MITRRRFLQGAGAAGAAALGAQACGGMRGGLGAPPIARPAAPILVVVDVDGGNDWLNVLPPTSGPNRIAYDTLRPTLGLPASGLADLGSGVGMNPDFGAMVDLYTRGRLALVTGVGMKSPNLSHFVSIDYWGQGAASPDGTGWLGRLADQAFSPTGDVLRGLTVTSDLPVMLRGSSRSFVSITGASGYVYPSPLRSSGRLGAPWDSTLLETAFGVAVGSAAPDPASAAGYAAGALAGKMFLDAQNGFGVDGALPARTPSVLYPGDAGYPLTRLNGGALSTGLANQLKLVARMIAADIPAQIYFTRMGGFDTHANQAVDHPNLLRALGGAVNSFYDDLAGVSTSQGNAQDRVVVMAWSEFGRRVRENNGGTDHGTAGLSFFVGRAVKGGLYGAYPDLTDLDNGNMRFTTDFRSLYATVLERWLGRTAAETDAILGAAYPRLDFLAA
ncbi:MAG TPA: DUF1501 domain-containing protein [Anaeromyxobacteraceae bacterium]|jgi:uncharacterized protein (DUF1501 family)